MTEEENKKVSEALDAASEWMDDLEGEPEAEVGVKFSKSVYQNHSKQHQMHNCLKKKDVLII